MNVASSRTVLEGTSGEEVRVLTQQSRIGGDGKEMSLRNPETCDAFSIDGSFQKLLC